MSGEAEFSVVCAGCGVEIAPGLQACPNCGQLIHAARLRELTAHARAATNAGDISSALAAWREALDLLPPDSRQYQVIRQKIIDLGRAMQAGVTPTTANAPPAEDREASHSGTGKKAAAGLGALGLLLLKFKSVLLLILLKGKLLLLGLSKASTFFSMLLSFGAYWSIWGWKFAAGLVLSTYVHEMGHVIALKRYGFKASAPMFIPGLGALIRLQQHIVDPREDAAIGLAGPIYGMGAAIVTGAAWYFTRLPILAVIAGVNAWINLFNLLPVWTLDGGRAFHSLSRMQRFIGAAACGGAWLITSRDGHPQGLLLVVGAVCLLRALTERTSDNQNDPLAAVQYASLVIVLSLLGQLQYEAPVNQDPWRSGRRTSNTMLVAPDEARELASPVTRFPRAPSARTGSDRP